MPIILYHHICIFILIFALYISGGLSWHPSHMNIQMNLKLDSIAKSRAPTNSISSISSFIMPSVKNIVSVPLERLLNKTFRIVEVVDHERVETTIDLLPTGAAVIRDSKAIAAGVTRASWRILDAKKTLQIAIERTYQGKVSQYSVMSLYSAGKAFGSIITGRVDKGIHDSDYASQNTGKFVMIPTNTKRS